MPMLTRVVDGAVVRVRARLEPHLDTLAHTVPRSVRAHTIDITLIVVAVAAAGGTLVLWIVLLWTVATLLAPHAPVWGSLMAMAAVHLIGAGALAARVEHKALREAQLALPPSTVEEAAGEAAEEAAATRPHRPRRHQRRRGWLSSPYRLLLASVAAGLALERVTR
jgi:hypothetical protein